MKEKTESIPNKGNDIEFFFMKITFFILDMKKKSKIMPQNLLIPAIAKIYTNYTNVKTIVKVLVIATYFEIEKFLCHST